VRILYVASDQSVPGAAGGSVHVLEVARGLAARGHDVHVVVWRQAGQPAEEHGDGVTWHRVRWWPPHRFFRSRATASVASIAERLRPDVVMERYYNFGGEGVAVATSRDIPALLEVNSPLIDHAGSPKALLDRVLLFQPLRRHRESLCRRAAALIAPLPGIVPAFAREKTVTVTWGANIERFRPGLHRAEVRRAWSVDDDTVVVLFSGSFRPWHGVHVLEDAARALADREELFFVLAGGREVGGGRGYRGRQLGAVAYEDMPGILAAADIGVAPYDTRRLAQLQLGFYWSPLKIFEYMAAGLPTVTIPRPPLTEVVRDGREGLYFREGDARDLAQALVRLAGDASLRRRLGESARARVVERYSWARHCEQLESVLQKVTS
jgi:glycosyltransferase involved in cell wall biosynthesis